MIQHQLPIRHRVSKIIQIIHHGRRQHCRSHGLRESFPARPRGLPELQYRSFSGPALVRDGVSTGSTGLVVCMSRMYLAHHRTSVSSSTSGSSLVSYACGYGGLVRLPGTGERSFGTLDAGLSFVFFWRWSSREFSRGPRCRSHTHLFDGPQRARESLQTKMSGSV